MYAQNEQVHVGAWPSFSLYDPFAHALGHGVRTLEDWSWSVGGGHGIMIDPDTGARYGGADPRRDGAAVGY